MRKPRAGSGKPAKPRSSVNGGPSPKPRVTMRAVAREAGVSTMTVSRALKDNGSVNAATRELVRRAADRLGYVYDTTAQAFRMQRSGFVALTLPSVNNANFATTHRAMTQALSATDLQILLGITGYRLEEEEAIFRRLAARRPEAVVLTGGTHTEVTRTLVGALGVPVVEIWDLPERPLGHAVGFSNADALVPIVQHLARTGRRRLAFLGASDHTDLRGAERGRGAIRAARALGLPDMAWLDAGPAPISMREGAAAILAAKAGLARYDAIVCVSDPVAFGALSACRSLGVDVPGDLAIAGFGAFEIASVSSPPITTVDVGAERIGTAAGEIIAAILAGYGSVPASTRVDTGSRLVPGGTT